MKKIIIVIFIVVAIVFGQEPTVKKINGEYSFVTDSKISVKILPTQLKANILLGDVLLRGTDSKEIRFTEKVLIKKRSEEDAMKLWKKIHTELKEKSQGFELENGLKDQKIRYGHALKSVKYIVDVPKEISVSLSTTGGDLNIKDINGEIELVTAGGDVILKKLDGKISVKTLGGDINSLNLEGNIDLFSAGGDVECKNIIGNTKMKTMGGDIILEVVKGIVKGKTFGGDISINEFDGNTVKLESYGGDIDVIRINGNVEVETAGGDITIDDITGNIVAETSGGCIEGMQITGNIIAETLGGEITIDDVFGSVKAETMSGDIEISKKYSDKKGDNSIVLKSGNGSIVLNIPKLIDGMIEAKAIGYNSDIISDFELNISKINSRKIIAVGKINDGTHKIELTTDNGKIIINKIK